MPKASTTILPVEIGMAHSSVFLSFMNMQCLEEFINEHTEPDSGHEPNFLYQTLGIILAVVSVVVDRWPL